MSRYRKQKIFSNDEEYYDYLRKKRGIKSVLHYSTPMLKNPTVVDRTLIVTTSHIWKYGDRFYNLAHKFYDDPSYWWIVAWYNGLPTEADIQNGDLIEIPINLNEALGVLGA